MNNIWLVYGLLHPDTNDLFYIGRSKGTKAMYRHSQPSTMETGYNMDKIAIIQDVLNQDKEIKYIILAAFKSRKQCEFKERILIAENKGRITNKRIG